MCVARFFGVSSSTNHTILLKFGACIVCLFRVTHGKYSIDHYEINRLKDKKLFISRCQHNSFIDSYLSLMDWWKERFLIETSLDSILSHWWIHCVWYDSGYNASLHACQHVIVTKQWFWTALLRACSWMLNIDLFCYGVTTNPFLLRLGQAMIYLFLVSV